MLAHFATHEELLEEQLARTLGKVVRSIDEAERTWAPSGSGTTPPRTCLTPFPLRGTSVMLNRLVVGAWAPDRVRSQPAIVMALRGPKIAPRCGSKAPLPPS